MSQSVKYLVVFIYMCKYIYLPVWRHTDLNIYIYLERERERDKATIFHIFASEKCTSLGKKNIENSQCIFSSVYKL